MKDNSLKRNLKICNAYARKAPKTINEAMNFETDDDLIASDEMESGVEEPDMGKDIENTKETEISEDESVKARKLIDSIRKMSLKAMAALADTPQSPEYESLKRIWTLCDRAVNEKEEQREIVSKQNGI